MRVSVVVRVVLAAAVLAWVPAPAALAHGGVDSPDGHFDEDAAAHDVSAEPRLSAHTREVTAADVRAAAAAIAGDEHDVGRWSPVVDWPVVGVHVALMPNGLIGLVRIPRAADRAPRADSEAGA